MIPLLLLIAWLGIRGLNADTLWYDEWYSLYYAGASPQHGPITLNQVWERVAQDNDPQPPGYYVLLSIWGRLVGWTPFATRALSLFLGILAVAGVYRLGSDLIDYRAGLAAAVTLGSSAFLIYHLHELRTYTLYPLLVTFSVWSYWRITTCKDKLPIWLSISFLLSTTALLYTSYLALPLLAAAGFYHLLFVKKDQHWVRMTLLTVFVLSLYLPWLNVAFGALTKVSDDPSRQFYALDPVSLMGDMLDTFSNGSIALFIIFMWYGLRNNAKRAAKFVWWMALATLALTIALNQYIGFITNPRYLMALWPLLALITGLGVSLMSARHLRPWLVIGIWVMAGTWLSLRPAASTTDNWQIHQSWDKLAQTLHRYAPPGDTVIYYLPEPAPYWVYAPVAAYYLNELPAVVEPMPPWIYAPAIASQTAFRLNLIESLVGKSPDAFSDDTAAIIDDLPRLWMAYSPGDLPSPFAQPAFEQAVANRFVTCDSVLADPDLQLTLYAQLRFAETTFRFGEGIELSLLAPLPQEADQYLPMLLGWSITDDTPRGMYSAAFHIEDEQGVLVAQADYGLPYTNQACQSVSVALHDLPAGEYTLWVMIYDWQSGERLLSKNTGG
jgi:hypothetical protein